MNKDEKKAFEEKCKLHGVTSKTIKTRMRLLNCTFEEALTGVTKVCVRCGKEYRAFHPDSRYCSKACYQAIYSARERRDIRDPFRKPTETTLFFVPFWHEEGMSAKEIAKMTNRDISIVEAILRGDYNDH